MNVSELIAKLQSILADQGNVPVLMSGWNDTGHVPVGRVAAEVCYKTDFAHDSDVRRANILGRDIENGFTSRVGAPFFAVVIEH